MRAPSDRPLPRWLASRWSHWLIGACLAAAALFAYHNSFSGPFVFDDIPAIRDNPSLKNLRALDQVLLPDLGGGVTTSGRPLVNLTFAINFAIHGNEVWGYHAVNLTIHVIAGLLLFGALRRSFAMPALVDRFGTAAPALAAAIALLWTVHPLQTSAVTYLVQRAESLVGLCYLLTLYCFIRSAGSPRATRWLSLSVIACALGMTAKEVMASAPLVVLLYDRTFVAGSFAQAWRQRGAYYGALGSTWILFGALVLMTGGRGGTVGFATPITAWDYALTQCDALVRYLGFVVWPTGLVFDYGTGTVRSLREVWVQAMLVVAMLGLSAWLLRRRSAAGFLAACFFLILAPSSSVVPITSQAIAEHRMYLPLAAVLTLIVATLYLRVRHLVWPFSIAAALACGALTSVRNQDYRDEFSLWADTVVKRPQSARAHNNFGNALFARGQIADALKHYAEAVRLQPAAEHHFNFGVALAEANRLPDAIAHFQAAVRAKPDHAEAQNNLGNALLQLGQPQEAVHHYQAALAAKPSYAAVHLNLGNALMQLQRHIEAAQQYEAALRLDPGLAEAHHNLGNVCDENGQPGEALAHFDRAIELNPRLAEVHHSRGNVLVKLKRFPEAIGSFESALAIDPRLAPARHTLARVLAYTGKIEAARRQYEQLLELRPDDPAVRRELDRLPRR